LTAVSDSNGTVKSVERALALLEAVATADSPPYAKDLAERVGLSLPTAFHLLKTLVNANYLSKESKTYALGDQISLLNSALERAYAPPARLRETLAKLAYVTRETANLCRWRSDDVEIVAGVEGMNAVRVAGHVVGRRGNAHARAAGKVLLAFGPADRRAAYLARPLPALTPNTICSAADLSDELDKVLANGYATDEEEYIPGVACVAAPVLGTGFVTTALALTAPADRFRETKPSLVAQIIATARAAGETPA